MGSPLSAGLSTYFSGFTVRELLFVCQLPCHGTTMVAHGSLVMFVPSGISPHARALSSGTGKQNHFGHHKRQIGLEITVMDDVKLGGRSGAS